MNFQKFLSVNLLLLVPTAAFAHIIAITANSPFPATMSTSSTATATYTVTNTSSHVPLTVIDQSQFPSSITIASSTCGKLMNPGQSCVINLRLQTSSTPQTISTELREWASPSADGVKSPINIQVSAASGARIAAGSYSDSVPNAFPLIAFSADGGNTWSYPVEKSGSLPLDYSTYGAGNGSALFNTTTCSGVVCLAGGNYIDTSSTGYPLVALSQNGGATWSFPIEKSNALPADYNDFGIVNGVSCNGVQSTALCTAVGGYQNPGSVSLPLLAHSTNGGSSWSYTTVSPPTFASGTLLGTTCNSSGSTGMCLASGYYSNGAVTYPLIALTNTGGTSWSYPLNSTSLLPNGFTNNGLLSEVICNGGVCLAIGSYNSGATIYPIIALSANGGNAWTYPIDKAAVLPTSYAGAISAGAG